MKYILNWINGEELEPSTKNWIEKYNPSTGELHSFLADSNFKDVNKAIESANNAFENWSSLTAIKRGEILFNIVNQMSLKLELLSNCISNETGKKKSDSISEIKGSISLGKFFAGEGRRLNGRTLNSEVQNKFSFTRLEPIGVAGLIVPANTPIANICWKIFPALICGNTVILKASEDAPEIALLLAKITKESGLPNGVFNVIQGEGEKAGSPIVENNKVGVISFTGSSITGKIIAKSASGRLARLSLELGGKNPFVVCDDANIDVAVDWAILSAFSNAGQRCASASRFIIFSKIYEEFKLKFINKTKQLRLGIKENSDVGPLINKKSLVFIENQISKAKSEGVKILIGGKKDLRKGYYFQPTIIENCSTESELYKNELFGPIAIMFKVNSIDQAIKLSNETSFGLTSAIHTIDINKAFYFCSKIRAGVANINMGTYGSEPHMPFGGLKDSGNGTREPGLEALNVYSELKNISVKTYLNG